MKKIAFLTSGGDSPGMNACIRAIVKSCLHYKITPVGIRDGFKGLMAADFFEMTYDDVDNIIQRGGTILGTARSKEFKDPEKRLVAIQNLVVNQIKGLIVIGGDGSFTGATILSQEMGIPIIGIPGTIDNDIYGTDHTIGYDTALNTVIEAIDKIRDTASSHQRVFFVEVMGKNAGFIALNAAIASGAESVLIPEEITQIELVADEIKSQNCGKRSSIVLVAEGDDAGGALEITSKLKPFLLGYDIRTTILGHIQRGGNPSAYDRILATRMGDFAVQSLINGKTNQMICVNGDQLSLLSIEDGIHLKARPDMSKLDVLIRMQTK